MSRPLRIEYENAYYHVMNRGRGRKAIFHDADYFQAFLETLSEASARFGVEIHAYCLMTNHYHLLIKTPQGNLQRAMRHIGGVYTQRYNRLKRTDGSLFRGRYKAILVQSDEYLLHLSKYIHLNPLEAKMVEHLNKYPWSSYPSYIKSAACPNWLKRDEVYEQLGYKSKHAKQYKRFVEELETDDEVWTFYSKQRHSPILGSPDFVEAIKKEQETLSSEIVRQESEVLKPDMSEIVQVTSDVLDVSIDYLTESKKGRGSLNLDRKAAMYLVQRIGDYRLVEIASYFGLQHYGSVAASIHAIKNEMKKNKKLVKKFNNIIKRFDP